MEYVTLNNGVKMPILGYGVYQTPPAGTEKCVLEAIQTGYRSGIPPYRYSGFLWK